MKKLLAVLLSCSQVFAVSPTLSQYVTALKGAVATLQGQTGAVPIIALSQQMVPVAASYFETSGACNPTHAFGSPGACTFNTPQVVNYFTASNKAGLSNADMSIAMSPLVASTEYATFCAANPSYTCLSPTATETASLANLDTMVAGIVAAGKTFALAPSPDSPAIIGCGWNVGTPTEATIEICSVPMIVAAALHFPGAIRITIYREPTGLFPLTYQVQLSAADWAILVTNTASVLHTNSPMAIGVAFTGGEGTYATASTTAPHLTFGGLDVYAGSCDLTTYATTLNGTYTTMKNTIIGNGLQAGVNEWVRPPWCPSGGPSGELNSIQGGGDLIWSIFQQNVDAMIQDACARWFASHGYKWFSIFGQQELIWYTTPDPTGTNDNFQRGPYMANLMANLNAAPSSTGVSHLRLNKGQSIDIRGHVSITGHAVVELYLPVIMRLARLYV